MKKKYGENIQLLFTDSDYLMYEVCTDDFYQDSWAMKKEFFKLRHSSSYGKTCENHAKHNDIRLLTETEVFQKLSGKPQRIFNVHLVGLYLKKVRIRINKPFYVGFAVMELSKLHMFKYVAYFIISICQ